MVISPRQSVPDDKTAIMRAWQEWAIVCAKPIACGMGEQNDQAPACRSCDLRDQGYREADRLLDRGCGSGAGGAREEPRFPRFQDRTPVDRALTDRPQPLHPAVLRGRA